MHAASTGGEALAAGHLQFFPGDFLVPACHHGLVAHHLAGWAVVEHDQVGLAGPVVEHGRMRMGGVVGRRSSTGKRGEATSGEQPGDTESGKAGLPLRDPGLWHRSGSLQAGDISPPLTITCLTYPRQY